MNDITRLGKFCLIMPFNRESNYSFSPVHKVNQQRESRLRDMPSHAFMPTKTVEEMSAQEAFEKGEPACGYAHAHAHAIMPGSNSKTGGPACGDAYAIPSRRPK